MLVEKEETNSLNAYNLDAIKTAEDSKSEKEGVLGEIASELCKGEGDFKDTKLHWQCVGWM